MRQQWFAVAVLAVGFVCCGVLPWSWSQTAIPSSARYQIDPARSSIVVHVFVGGLFSVFGHEHTIAARSFAGNAGLASGLIGPATLEVAIDSGSLAETSSQFSPEDRTKIDDTMHRQVLESDKYPQIIFKGTEVSITGANGREYNARIAGKLTLHGVTRAIAVNARAVVNGSTIQATGEFSVKHSDYGMKRISVAGGTVKVKDDIKITFSVVASRSPR